MYAVIKEIFGILIKGLYTKEEDYDNRLKKAGKTLQEFKTKFDVIPSELYIELSIILPYKDLFKFMRTNKEVYNVLKNSKYLWKKKFYQEFGKEVQFPKLYVRVLDQVVPTFPPLTRELMKS